MDFHTLPRRDLQALCKKNRIPANLTNAAMADALGALPTVEGMDEPSQFQSPQKPEILSPDLPRTGRRTAARRAAPAPAPTPPPVAPEEPREGQASPLPRARRVTAKVVATEEEEAPQKPEILSPDLPRTGRRTAARRAAAAPTPPPVAPEDPREGQASPLPRARQVTAKAVATEEEEAPEPEKADTPVVRTGRKPRVLPTPVTRPTTRTRASKQAVEVAPTPATGTTGLKTKVVEVAPTPATGTTGLKTKKSSVKKTEEPLAATVNTGRSSRGRAAAKMTSLLQETATAAATANAGRRSTRLRGVGKMASLLHEPDEHEGKDANREAQVGEDSDLCPSEPQAGIIESEKQITVSKIKKCQATQEPSDPTPVEENVEGNADSNSKSQPLDSIPVEEENPEGDGDLNTELEIVEEIQEPAEDVVEGVGDSKLEPEIKECHEVQEPDSAPVKESVEDGAANSESEIINCHEVQDPLDSAPVEEKNVEDGAVSESEIIECHAVQVQEPLGSASVQENVEDSVVSKSEIGEFEEVQVQESLESAPVEDNDEGGVNIKEFQEVQEPLESAPVEGNKEFQEVQEPLESASVDENVECDEYSKPVSDDSPVWGLVDEQGLEEDVVGQSDFHCDLSPVIAEVFGDLSPINEAVEDSSPPFDAVAEDEAEITVVSEAIEAVDNMVHTIEHFEEQLTVSEVVEHNEPKATNESDSIGILSDSPATNVSADDEQLEVSEGVEHFVELVDGSEAVVEHFIEQVAGVEVKVLEQFVEEVAVDSKTTEESDTVAASSPAILSADLIATAAVLSPIIDSSEEAEESQQSPATESGELKSVTPLVAASSPPDLSTAVSPVKESSDVDFVLTGEPALAGDTVVVEAEDSSESESIAISLINEVAGVADLHQQELKAPANVVEKEPELSSDVATDIDGGDCDDKENNGGEAKGKKPIRRHVVYSKLSMRKLKSILKERLAATAKNSNTGEGKKVEVKRTALRALDENQL